MTYVGRVVVDLRSDTVTQPTAQMRRAMAEAEVGDDQYGEDPTVRALEERFAQMVGKEAGLYVPSGTMANQIALRLLTRPGDAVIVGGRQHVVLYEQGAGPVNAGITWLALDDADGCLDPSAVARASAGADHHHPRSSAVFVEDSHMAAGGACWPAGRLDQVATVAGERGLDIHLDGARLWNAAVASGRSLAERAGPATTVMCCLSKGLAAPVGSVLAGPAALIAQGRLHRHRLGGAMRQAGVIAAAGLVALGCMVERLAEDHERARRLAGAVADRWPAAGEGTPGPQTNIVIFSHTDTQKLLDHLGARGVLAGTVAPGRVRLVTHHGIDDAGVDQACAALLASPI